MLLRRSLLEPLQMSWALTFEICFQISTLTSASSILATSNTTFQNQQASVLVEKTPGISWPKVPLKEEDDGGNRKWLTARWTLYQQRFYQHWWLFHIGKNKELQQRVFWGGLHAPTLVPTGIDKRSIKHLSGCGPIGPLPFQVLPPHYNGFQLALYWGDEWANLEKFHLDKSSKDKSLYHWRWLSFL